MEGGTLGGFDPQEARRIRKEAGLTQTELAKEIKMKSLTTICNYETGNKVPKRTTESGRKYLSWLAEQGYN